MTYINLQTILLKKFVSQFDEDESEKVETVQEIIFNNVCAWGKLVTGVSMTPRDLIIEKPEILTGLIPYEFNKVTFGSNFAIAAGHSCKFTLEIPDENGNYGL